jgi:putative ATPase
MAVEDIGLADPQALPLAMAAQQAVHFLGLPEGALALAECAVYLATAPKSNRLYTGYAQAQADVLQTRNDPVPLHLRNAPTQLMKNLGYGKDYKYAHDYEGGFVYQQNLPESLEDRRYYEPTGRGYEAELAQRLAGWRSQAAAARTAPPDAPAATKVADTQAKPAATQVAGVQAKPAATQAEPGAASNSRQARPDQAKTGAAKATPPEVEPFEDYDPDPPI